MQMQEPEHGTQSGSRGQSGQTSDAYWENYANEAPVKPQEKIYPQQWRGRYKALWVITLILSALGFASASVGIISAAIVLHYADGYGRLVGGELLGLISSIAVMLLYIAIFVIAFVALTWPIKRGR